MTSHSLTFSEFHTFLTANIIIFDSLSKFYLAKRNVIITFDKLYTLPCQIVRNSTMTVNGMWTN